MSVRRRVKEDILRRGWLEFRVIAAVVRIALGVDGGEQASRL